MLLPVHPDETGTGYAHDYHLYLIVEVLPDAASHPEMHQVGVELDACLECPETTPARPWAEAASLPILTETPTVIQPTS
jgi:hypothetical protein